MAKQGGEFAKEIGNRIRRERKHQRLTLKQLGERAGLSVAYLSQIENNRVNIGLATLDAISRGLSVPMISLLAGESLPEVSVVRAAERHWIGLNHESAERIALVLKGRGRLEVFAICMPPGTKSIRDSCHEGEEFTYIVRGSVTVVIDRTRRYDLQEGDAIHYVSSIPHHWENMAGSGMAEILVVNTPATY